MFNTTQEDERRERQRSPRKQAEHEVKKCKRAVVEVEAAIESLGVFTAQLDTRKAALADAVAKLAQFTDSD
jgi:hypothetical protein